METSKRVNTRMVVQVRMRVARVDGRGDEGTLAHLDSSWSILSRNLRVYLVFRYIPFSLNFKLAYLNLDSEPQNKIVLPNRLTWFQHDNSSDVLCRLSSVLHNPRQRIQRVHHQNPCTAPNHIGCYQPVFCQDSTALAPHRQSTWFC